MKFALEDLVGSPRPEEDIEGDKLTGFAFVTASGVKVFTIELDTIEQWKWGLLHKEERQLIDIEEYLGDSVDGLFTQSLLPFEVNLA